MQKVMATRAWADLSALRRRPLRGGARAIESKATSRRKIGPGDYQAEGLVYLVPQARFGALLDLPEGSNIGRAVNDTMRMIEENNPDLNGILPRSYTAIPNETIASLLRHISSYTKNLEGDAFAGARTRELEDSVDSVLEQLLSERT